MAPNHHPPAPRAAASPPHSQHPPQQRNTRPTPPAQLALTQLLRRRLPATTEREAPPAAPPLPPRPPGDLAFGLPGQRCPSERTVYSDRVGQAAPDARRGGPYASVAHRSLGSTSPRPRGSTGFVAGLSRSVALAPHCARFAGAVPDPTPPPSSTPDTGYRISAALRPPPGADNSRFRSPPPPSAARRRGF